MSRHDPKKVYQSLLRRLDRVQSLAGDEVWLREVRVVDSPHAFDAAHRAARDLRRETLDAVQQMLAGLERAGALTRSGANAITAIFACASREGTHRGSLRRAHYERRMQWAWFVERIRHALRWLLRSAS